MRIGALKRDAVFGRNVQCWSFETHIRATFGEIGRHNPIEAAGLESPK